MFTAKQQMNMMKFKQFAETTRFVEPSLVRKIDRDAVLHVFPRWHELNESLHM